MMEAGQRAATLICGAGIAGIATAYFLTKVHGLRDVVLIDYRAPLTLTSDKSSEAYRNWWPGPGDDMVRFMNRSIDLLQALAEESGNRFHMSQRGYAYFTADPRRAATFRQEAADISHLGAGPLRSNPSAYEYSALAHPEVELTGADLIDDPAVIQRVFPFLARDTLAMLHARRCGWLSAQQLGMYLLEEARNHGARVINATVIGATVHRNRITSVEIQTNEGRQAIPTDHFVIAAGPLIAQVAALLNVDLPVYNEVHGKIAFEDTEGIIDRDAPLMIWNDPLTLPWTEEEREELAIDEEMAWLLNEFPGGLHFRPEGGPGSQTVLVVWPFHIERQKEPVWPVHFEPEFVEVSMRGMVRMVPDLAIYLDRMSRPVVDGGYYCKTAENRPLIGPLPVENTYLIGALSGYGIMAAPAAAELVSAHIIKGQMPSYARAFDIARYQDPAYRKLLESWSATTGEL